VGDVVKMDKANKLHISANSITIIGDVQEQLVDFYPVHTNRKKTEFTVSAHKLPEILKLFRNIDTYQALPQKIQDQYLQEIISRDNVADLLASGPRQSPVVTPHLTLMRHQQLGREIAQYRDRYGFFYDTRTGKTPLSLSIIYDDIKANPGNKWLIICPLILIENAWLEDARRFMPDLPICNCWAPTKDKRIKAIQFDANVFITNTESFVSYKEYFEQLNLTGVIVDESSDLKSHSSKISKAIVDFAHKVKRFYLLSGTPAPNGEWEYYMQMRAIDYYSMPQSYTQFKQYFFINTSYNPQYEKLVVKPDKREHLISMIKEHAIYIDKEDVLNTPGRTFVEIEMTLPSELKKHYNKLKNELYLDVQEGLQIAAPSAAAKLNKLNQLTSGFIIDTQAKKENEFYDKDDPEWYLFDTYRFDKLDELLANIGETQVLIWANYRIEFELIQQRLGDRCKVIHGGVSIEDKNNAIKLFKSGRIPYLVANPASADKGLTLTNCYTSIYFSLNWSYELFKQSMERIYGDIKSQPNHCTYYIMLTKGTIDKILYSDVLQGKGKASIAVLNHLKGGLQA